MQGVVFFSTNRLELRYVFFLYLIHPLRTQVQVWNKAGKISPFSSWVCNLNGTQQTNVPAVACDVLPSMQTKKIKNIFCSEIYRRQKDFRKHARNTISCNNVKPWVICMICLSYNYSGWWQDCDRILNKRGTQQSFTWEGSAQRSNAV